MKATGKIKTWILNFPFWIMMFFTIFHLGVYVRFYIGERQVSFSWVNQVASLGYVCAVYLWALWINQKNYIKIVSILMGILSFCGIVLSLNGSRGSVNDVLFAGTAVLTIFYVFENAQYLSELVKKLDAVLAVAIWMFVGFTVVLFVFFPDYQTQWGAGTFLFGHRFASVCSLAIMLIGLKLTNSPKHKAVYWAMMIVYYYLCFWTGARIYMISNLGQLYAMLFVFRKNNKDFIIKCIAVTLVAVMAFFTTSASAKFENIIEITNNSLEEKAEQNELVDESYEWSNAISNGRVSIWTNCIETYANLPLGNKLIGSGNSYVYTVTVQGAYAHTDFLNILFFNGLIGLLVYLVVFLGYVGYYWHSNKLPIIVLIGFWGIWFVLALLNGYGNYTADMMSLPYMSVLALWDKNNQKTAKKQ